MSAEAMFLKTGSNTAAFIVEVNGIPAGSFSECHGLAIELQVETLEEGGVNSFVHRLPGRVVWPNIVLKRGVTWDNELFDWFNKAAGSTFAADGKVTREAVGITMVSSKGKRLRTWNLVDALPVRWKGPTFATSLDGIPDEELELSHNGFTAETFKES